MNARLLEIKKRLREIGKEHIRIIAVSKTHPPSAISELLREGQRDFGENRFNEARDKIPLVDISGLSETTCPIYHHIGPLQSGNARQIPEIFDWIHGASSEKAINILADSCIKKMEQNNLRFPLHYLIQVNLTGEATKTGGIPYEKLILMNRFIENEALKFSGFMTMGPSSGDPVETREVFHRLREIRDELLPGGELSMGMSGDWQIAAKEGATMVRLGSVLFGERKEKPWKP